MSEHVKCPKLGRFNYRILRHKKNETRPKKEGKEKNNLSHQKGTKLKKEKKTEKKKSKERDSQGRKVKLSKLKSN